MKLIQFPSESAVRWFAGLVLAITLPALSASLPSDWQFEQHFRVPTSGLVKLSLPPNILDRSRPALEDLRLYDESGQEIPYLIERPRPGTKISQRPKSFQLSLGPDQTSILLETGFAGAIEAITLETPALHFIKSVEIAGSDDGKAWQTLVRGMPIFRQSTAATQLRLDLPAATFRWLRLTIDDRRSQPIPFSGALIHAAGTSAVPTESFTTNILERNENPEETRLSLDLGAAHLDLASVQIETSDPLFTRGVTVAEAQVLDDSIREQTLAQGTIYRVSLPGEPTSTSLTVPIGRQASSAELLLIIRNENSPPLTISSVRVERWPVHLIYFARQPGSYHLLTGNSRCSQPRYDLGPLAQRLPGVPLQSFAVSPLAENPDFRRPEILPGLAVEGVTLDVSGWNFFKPVRVSSAGVQQIELDLDVLSHADAGFQDLRLLGEGRQRPYILQRTSISRDLKPVVTVSADPKDPSATRWMAELPAPRLPLRILKCTSRTAIFQRQMTLFEEVIDERGEKYRRNLGAASWRRAPDNSNAELVVPIDTLPVGDVLWLETRNGDNPAIELENFHFFYSATRMLFKTKSNDSLLLYYGNPKAGAPSYDLNLVANQLMRASKSVATLGTETPLKKSSWATHPIAGKGGLLLWAVLALVVIGLLVIIARLVPTSEPKPK